MKLFYWVQRGSLSGTIHPRSNRKNTTKYQPGSRNSHDALRSCLLSIVQMRINPISVRTERLRGGNEAMVWLMTDGATRRAATETLRSPRQPASSCTGRSHPAGCSPAGTASTGRAWRTASGWDRSILSFNCADVCTWNISQRRHRGRCTCLCVCRHSQHRGSQISSWPGGRWSAENEDKCVLFFYSYLVYFAPFSVWRPKRSHKTHNSLLPVIVRHIPWTSVRVGHSWCIQVHVVKSLSANSDVLVYLLSFHYITFDNQIDNISTMSHSFLHRKILNILFETWSHQIAVSRLNQTFISDNFPNGLLRQFF